ncbi:MAG: hypothetical protein GY867_03900, partial [bacterium]|nr:hypothetical protein [bacterium]
MNKTEEKIQIERTARFNERLSKTILSDPISLDLRYAKSDGEVSFESRTDLKYSPIEQGNEWGQRWEVAWFDCRVEIPESYFGHELAVRIDLGGEGLVYDDSGNMLQGISSGSVFDSEFSRDLIHLGALP